MRDHADAQRDALLVARPPSQTRSPRRRIIGAALALVAAAAVAGGVRFGAPVEAERLVVSAAAFPVSIKGPGTLDALRRATLSTTAQGRL